jgi:uncharacterized protein YcgI (DUF1989 family)|tara:strand:- start:227 stop:862 length:636 start_codon:yes stop_codon:yes gene_type:complete
LLGEQDWKTVVASQKIEIPGYQGRAVVVGTGAAVRITDVEGAQIGDLFLLAADDLEEVFSAAMTRLVTFHLFPTIGESFYSNRRREMLTFTGDTSPGRHDMTFAPCDSEFYEELVGETGHPNCHDNFMSAVAQLDFDGRLPPDPINLFQSSMPNTEGGFDIERSPSGPGDFVEFETQMDLLLVLTACSADIKIEDVDVIGGRSTPLLLEIG